ncbi:24678_t:CDS:2, partial [Gigaspora margarita]
MTKSYSRKGSLDINDEIDLEEDEDDKEIDNSIIKVLYNFTDICTRWNFSYFLWTRLLELKDALTWLATMLLLKKGKENKKDGSQYPTLSIMYSIIRKLQNQFIEFSLELNNNKNSSNENDMLLDSENNDNTPPLPPDLDQIERQFKIAISNSLNKYWHNFCEVGLNLHFNITSNDQPEQQTSMVIVTEIMQSPFFEGIFGVQDQEDMPLDK